MVHEVDEETLDVGAVLVLIGHDHHLPVAEALKVVCGQVPVREEDTGRNQKTTGKANSLFFVLQSQDLDQLVDFLVLHDLLVGSLSHVQKLSYVQGRNKKIENRTLDNKDALFLTHERVHAVVVPPDDGEPGHCQSQGRVSFGQDERAADRIPTKSKSLDCRKNFGLVSM